MSDLTYPERLYAEAELRFAQHMVSLGGWRSNGPNLLTDVERQIANNWMAAGLLRRAEKDRREVIQLTAAGYTWCRENGIGA